MVINTAVSAQRQGPNLRSTVRCSVLEGHTATTLQLKPVTSGANSACSMDKFVNNGLLTLAPIVQLSCEINNIIIVYLCVEIN